MPLNNLSFRFSLFMLMWFCSVACRLLLIFSVLAEPFLAVVGWFSLWSRSMSLTFRLCSSFGLNPVSLLIVSLSDSVGLALAISISIFSFVGILRVFTSVL